MKCLMRNKNFLLSLLAIVLLFVLFFGTRYFLSFGLRQPNIILISVDALRADHLASYGYTKNNTPTIDAIAQEGVIFTNAISQSSYTYPSLYCLLTARYPSTHGVLFWDQALAASIPTLPLLLKERKKYATAFMSEHGALNSLRQHFDTFVDKEDAQEGEITHRAILWIQQHRKRSFFLWLHYMGTHSRYSSDVPIEKRTRAYLTKNQIEKGFQRYDAAIEQFDAQLKILSSKLKDLGMSRNTLIIITADHGEEMGEHSYYFVHGGVLWDSLLKVPLILWYPRLFGKGKVIHQQVQLIDIMPTIMEMAGVKKDDALEGESLLPLIGHGKTETSRFAFSEITENNEDKKSDPYLSNEIWYYSCYSVRQADGYKLIATFYSDGRQEYSLYNIGSDPQELCNLAEIEKTQLSDLKTKLGSWLKVHQSNAAPLRKPLDTKTKERLKSLGYIN